jgi:putative salt-induced outer membrane protein YdiY
MTVSRALIKIVTLVIFLALAIGAGSTPAFADTVELSDGNILQGTVSSLEKGTLIFSTEYAKKNKIPVGNIKTISTDTAVTVKMTNDSIFTGKLTTLEDGRVAIILEPVGETVPIEWDQVKKINEPPGSWDGNISLGGNVKSGNTESVTINLSLAALREWENDRFQFRFFYNYEEDNNTLSGRDFFGTMKFDHFFTTNFFNALSLEIKGDEFKDLNLRTTIGLGVGYRFWNDDVKVLELEAGVSYFSENLDVGMDQEFFAGRFGLTFSYKIFENLSIKDYLLYYPSFERPKEYRLRNELSLISALGADWSTKVTYIFDQDTEATFGTLQKDHQVIFAIQYTF